MIPTCMYACIMYACMHACMHAWMHACKEGRQEGRKAGRKEGRQYIYIYFSNPLSNKGGGGRRLGFCRSQTWVKSDRAFPTKSQPTTPLFQRTFPCCAKFLALQNLNPGSDPHRLIMSDPSILARVYVSKKNDFVEAVAFVQRKASEKTNKYFKAVQRYSMKEC